MISCFYFIGKLKMLQLLTKKEIQRLADAFGDLNCTHEEIADAGRDLVLKKLVP